MKRLFKAAVTYVTLALLSVFSLIQPLTAHAAGANLVQNPSVETAAGSAPANWSNGGWGTNTATYTWQNTGKDGGRSLAVNVTKYTNGDAKWTSDVITVTPSTQYKLSDWYISNVQTSLELAYTHANGSTTYAWLKNAAATTTWKQVNGTFTTPADVNKVTVYHVLAKKGSLQTDAYELTSTAVTPPTPTPTPPSVTITTPAANATVSGTQAITATATDTVAVSGVQFKIDGANFGVEDTTAPYTTSVDTTTLINGAHTVSAVARNNSNLTATAAVNVTVNNVVTPPAPNPTPGNLIANPSVETASGAVPASWGSNNWGTNTVQFSYLNSGHTGNRSLKTDVTAYTNGDAKWYFTDVPVTPGKTYQYSNWYQSNVDSEIDVAVTMQDGTVQYYYLTTASASASWKEVSGQFTAPVNARSLTIFQVLNKKGYVISDDFSLTEYTPAGWNRAMVSLTFDDGWRSQYDNALPILNKYDMDATFYMLTETVDYPDYMTVSMMQSLKNAGNEIDSHTISHPHLPQLALAAMTTELSQSQSQLRQWFGASAADDFASPYGEYNTTTLTEIKKHYRSHRSTDEGFNSKDKFDIYNIKVQNILYSTPASQVKAWVEQAQREHTWLVLVYHEIATAVEDPTYSISPADLDAQAAAIKASGIAVRTVGQALDEIRPQL